MPQSSPYHILVIEDEADTRANLRDILEMDGYQVETAETSAAALDRNNWSQLTAITLDWRLPDGTAETLLPQLRRLAPDAAVIVSTGVGDLNSAVTALRHGAVDYILKPIDGDVLRNSVRQIVAAKETKAALAVSQRRMQALFNSTLDAILLADDDGSIVDANPAATELLGYGRSELLSKKTAEVVSETAWHCLQASSAAQGERHHEFRIQHKNGTIVIVEFHAVAHMMPGLHLIVLHDITDLTAAQQRLVQSERLAAIGKAMAGLAHESRNALQRSQAGLEMLARRVGNRPEAMELVTRIQKAQDDLHQLYEEVREYASPIRFDINRCDLGELIHETWDQLASSRMQRTVHLHADAGGIDLRCEIDRFAIRQVFRNILENALAACDEPVEINVRFSETNLDGRPAVEIAVSDNGPGLSPEQRHRIFEEFFTTKTHGTGLGMAIVKRFIDAHAGRVEADSNSSGGAVIRITLPRKQP